MNGARLLIVDDEPQIVRSLRPGLAAAGYIVEAVGTGHEALQAMAANAFDVVIVDLGLPDMDGKDLIARYRQWGKTPIIVLSARDAELEKINALDSGANDFVNKPFSIGELMARLRATLRIHVSTNVSPSDRLQVAHLDIDFRNAPCSCQRQRSAPIASRNKTASNVHSAPWPGLDPQTDSGCGLGRR